MATDEEIAELQRTLEKRLEELIQESTSMKPGTSVELDQQRVGRLSRMDALQQQAMEGALKRHKHEERTAIVAALKRVEIGSYGQCIYCGEEIPTARLRARPTALSCIECARS